MGRSIHVSVLRDARRQLERAARALLKAEINRHLPGYQVSSLLSEARNLMSAAEARLVDCDSVERTDK